MKTSHKSKRIERKAVGEPAQLVSLPPLLLQELRCQILRLELPVASHVERSARSLHPTASYMLVYCCFPLLENVSFLIYVLLLKPHCGDTADVLSGFV